MFEFNEQVVSDWFENHRRSGGKIWAVNFKNYFEKFYLGTNNIPRDLYNSIKKFKESEIKDVIAYSQISSSKEFNHLRFDTYYYQERASHMIWLIHQPEIVYKPNISYSNVNQNLRLIQGGGRLLSLYYNHSNIPVIYYDYGSMPSVILDDMILINSVDELLLSLRIDGNRYNDKAEVLPLSKKLFNDCDDNQYDFLNYACSGALNFTSQSQWQKKSVHYWNVLQECSSVENAVEEITSVQHNIFRD